MEKAMPSDVTQTLTPKNEASPERELTRLGLDGMGSLGDTCAQFEGETINVFGGIPGEEVVAWIVRYRRRRVNRVSAMVTEVLTPSPHRVAPPCPYFGPCSGCQWQHIDYPYQLRLKQEAVERQLRRYPALGQVAVAPTVTAQREFNYRNHARFTVRREGTLGFSNRITRRFVQVDECMLMAPWINGALGKLQGRCGETTQLSIRYGENTGEWLIQPTLQTDEVPLPTGQTHFRETVSGHTFRVASPSFFQVNTMQAERLAELVGDRLELRKSDVLVDAYAGVGTFAALMAPRAGRVIAIEESAAAVKDAAINTLGIDNLEFLEGRTEEVLAGMERRPDAVILDPPRAGCHPSALEALSRLGPPRIVYVSCDPETLARDLDLLAKGGFDVESVEPVDMFPQTYHVECVATLSLGTR